MQTYRKEFPAPDIYGQFGKLTDRKEIPVPELAEGALTKPYIYSVAHASSSERYVLIPCSSVANAFGSAILPSVSNLLPLLILLSVDSASFRVIPCSSVANASAYS